MPKKAGTGKRGTSGGSIPRSRQRASRATPLPPMNRRQFSRQRQGVVETKSRTHEEISTTGGVQPIHNPMAFVPINYNKACTFLHPSSFLSFNQGMDEMDLIGLTAFVKAVKMKINLKLPFGENAIPGTPFNLYLVHGTVQSTNFTGNTTPSANQANRATIRTHIESKVEDYFDERADKLRFIPKNGVTVQILGYKKMLNDKNTSWLAEATGSSPYKKSINWQMNKKVKYEKGYPQLSVPQTMNHQQHLYPNYTRLPFCLIYCPQFAELSTHAGQGGDERKILYAYNDCTWFTDS